MTTQILTNNKQGSLNEGLALPDLQLLNQLASQMFAQLPNGATPPNTAIQNHSPSISQASNPLSVNTPPRIANVPRPELEGANEPAPTLTGNKGLGIPQSYAAALPHLPTSLLDRPNTESPFYFLADHSSQEPSHTQALNHQDLLISETLVAQSFALPSSQDLRALLAGTQQSPSSSDLHLPSAQSFYYVESNQPNITRGRGAPTTFDVHAVRRDFPILAERVNGKPLVWLDNAATTHKPTSVIERISYFYQHENSNIHRAAHELAARATDAYEAAREKVRAFINARSTNEIVFVRGTTEAINLIAKSWGAQYLKRGDEIVISWLEHHANIVPWQQLAAEKGLVLKVAPVDDSGQIIIDEYAKLLTPRVKLVSFTQVSNALGTITPAQQMVAMAHAIGAKVLVDGAQSVSHLRTDVQSLDADWLVFSGHKMFAPTGIGVVYGKEALLNDTQPWQGGGNMIQDVTFEQTQYHAAPARFEAGTGNIADAVGLGAAIDYINQFGIDTLGAYEHGLLEYGTYQLQTVKGLKLIGTAEHKASVLSFVLEGYSTVQVGEALSKEGIAVRSGHHCAQPILRRFGLEATVRPSLAFYNTCEEIDLLVSVLKRLKR